MQKKIRTKHVFGDFFLYENTKNVDRKQLALLKWRYYDNSGKTFTAYHRNACKSMTDDHGQAEYGESDLGQLKKICSTRPARLSKRIALRGCLHDTGMTFIPVWLGSFIPVWVFRRHLGLVDEKLRMRYPFQPTKRPFQTETSGRSVFTWYRYEFSFRNENLVLVRQPGGTHSGMSRTGMRFWIGIM